MATPRRTSSGKWELALWHPSLPKGRKYFTFDTEAQASAYAAQWALLVKAGLPIPAELLEASAAPDTTLGAVLRAWANHGHASATDKAIMGWLLPRVGATPLKEVTYRWATGWVQAMKLQDNLAPSSIRQRVGAAARALDEHLRRTSPDLALAGNPLRALPDGYSTYTESERALMAAGADKQAKEDTERDVRLARGDHERILAALDGGLRVPDAADMRMLYLVIHATGARLKEAYTLTRAQVNLEARTIRLQTSKQWRGKVKFRDVPIRPELYPELAAWVRSRTGLLFTALWDGAEPLPRVSARLSARFRQIFNHVGRTDLTEHDLRHEATCRWFELRDASGHWMFRPEEIHRIMGWAAGSRMAARYASFRGDDLAARLWSHEASSPSPSPSPTTSHPAPVRSVA